MILTYIFLVIDRAILAFLPNYPAPSMYQLQENTHSNDMYLKWALIRVICALAIGIIITILKLIF